ncbi:hypothetical protein ABIA39_000141 [Nocardia sp. GAS34]|uniref:hypothetical protein n=1 Tax=unclassified Nocardia TaxID=2637762 RepID=UPI003D20086E
MEEIGGKIFQTPEEAGVPRLTEEEMAAIRAKFDEYNRQRAAGEWREHTQKLPGRFGGTDDLAGTEYEGWTRDASTGQWYDKDGRPVDDSK